MSVQLEALDILADLLSRFGALLISFHSPIQTALLPQLASKVSHCVLIYVYGSLSMVVLCL